MTRKPPAGKGGATKAGDGVNVPMISLAGLSEQEVERAVAERCASYGTVRKLKVYLPRQGSSARPFALVDMSTREEAERLAAALGRLTIDDAVIVFLRQQYDRTAVLVWGRYRANHSADTPRSPMD